MRDTKIKAVIFDMGGVIVRLDREKCVKEYKEKAGFLDIEDYIDVYHQRGFISDLEEGLISEEQFYAEALGHCRPGTTAQLVEKCFCSLLKDLNPSAVEAIKTLLSKYELYVLSNNNPMAARDFLRKISGVGLENCFRKMFFSFEMKLLKPGRAIFDKVIEEIGCKPEEAVLIDDAPMNIEGAQAAGIRTILYRDGTDILSEVERFA